MVVKSHATSSPSYVIKGYCEGVVGRFNAENVHFVELDPRVLESLDGGGLDIESLGVRSSIDQGERYPYYGRHQQPRQSMQSYHSSTSQEYTSSSHTHDYLHGNDSGKQPWIGRSSMDSLLTTSTTSGTSHLYGKRKVQEKKSGMTSNISSSLLYHQIRMANVYIDPHTCLR
jgi:hypothetical protein